MFDAVLFDLDGTLLDSIELILVSYRHTLEAHGLAPRSDEDVLSGLGMTLRAQFERWGEGDVEELIATYVAHNLKLHDTLARPYPGLGEIVRQLRARGTPLGLVTSKRRVGATRGLAALGLEGSFDVLVCGDEVGHPKPDPEPVERALALLGLAPSRRVTFVGDSTHDVRSGRAAGVHTIAVTWGAGDRRELLEADVVVDEARELGRALGLSGAAPAA